MKKPTFSKAVYAVIILLLSLTTVAQNFVMPTIRKNLELKGNMLVIGNNILGKSSSGALNDLSVNETTPMVNIDIDGDPNTLNSSSADLKVPSTTTCFRIAYAGLYWGSILQSGSRADINKVKLKLPGSSSYTQINGTLIYDANVAPIDPDNNKPYACYADVTSLLTGLSNPQGTYTVADVVTNTGYNGLTGLAAGWTLYVVYEDPQATTKSFTSFDGFSALYDGKTLPIKINGFLTAPTGTINLKFGFASLNGDKTANGSKVEVSSPPANGTAIITAERPSNTFFNSSITDINGYQNSRNPNGTNSIGYDTGIEELLDVNKSTVDHNSTSATITLQVAKGQANPIFTFFNCFSVDVIAPDIQLTKIVKNGSNVDIGGSNVVLGDNLFYEISYKNIGNDNVTGIAPNAKMIIKDILPKNVILNYPADPSSIDLSYSGGATVKSYDPITRTIIFEVPDAAVKVGLPNPYMIRLKVQVVPDCNMLVDACSNEIKNQAFASYTGYINKTPIVEEGSFASTVCNFGTGTSTNFLVNIDNCKFTKKVVLCNTSVILTAPNGYDSYVWSKTLGGSSIGTGSTYTATQTGTYYVHATSLSTCLPIDQEITVVPFGNTVTNPVIPYAQSPYAGSVTTCTINGKLLPNLFLCGANDFRDIKTGITDATSIIWEKLNENSTTCKAADSNTICANESASCSWSQVGTGPDYKANTAGQYRLTINYTGGCFSVFYFNVFQNLLNPTVVSKDITCNTKGEITVKGIPESGYEYSLDNGGTGTYQASNVFNNVSAGFHDVYVRQIGVVNGCLFKVLGVYIQNRVYQVGVNVVQPLCNGGKGSVTLQANNVLPQYYYSISQGATVVNSAGPINVSNFTFSNLNPGTYTVRVWTDDGCDYSQDIAINDPPLFTATAVLTTPLTCTDGLITVNTFNGTSPYKYYVNSTTSFQNTNQVTVSNPLPTGGIYNIDVTDSKGCLAKTSITVVATPAPVYTIGTINVLCYGDATGAIQFNVTSNLGGYTLSYSIDDGVTYSSNPVFSGLSADVVYTPKLRYTLDGVNYCYDTKPTVTLTGPSTALTASAGVSELAGCTLSGQGGKLRITNPQGGVAPYLYSFDNQLTWVTTNEADMLPGTYTLYIKDANGCIYPMPNIVLDPKPVAPTIAISSPVFNCNGTATTTATVTNSGSASYQYGYLLDGTANTNVPSNVFVNVPSGSHTVSVTYKLLTVPTYSNLLKEDFGSGTEVTSPGINTNFCFEKQNFLTCDKNGTLNNGEYTVTNSIKNSMYSGWHNPVDHTTGSATGRYLAVDAGIAIPNNAVLYRKTIKDIIPNQPIQVRFFATNLLKTTNTQPDASLTVELQSSAGGALSSSSTGGIPKTNGWVEYNKTIDPGNNTTLDFVLRLEIAQINGIDFAVDDLEVYQLPKSCITQVDFPFEVPTGKAFDASITGTKNVSCAGANDGEITIAAQNFDPTKGFQYSINNGTTWNTQMTSPYTITGLSPNNYTVLIRYDASSTGSCVKTILKSITGPTALTVTASVTTQATCTTGASITAGASGGTAAYQYELRQSDGVTVVTAFNTNTVFTNVPVGNYTVFAKDANNCITSVGAVVNVVAPPTLSAAIDPTSDFCYDTVNKASLKVNVTGGTSPFTYSLDGAAAQNTNTFTNVGVGPHSILVTDSKNCTATISNISIASQLKLTAALAQDLTCLVNASITTTVSGGYGAPYTYTVSHNGGAATTVASFPYTTNLSGTYVFTVTDSKGCPATSNTITVTPKTTPTLTFNKTDNTCNNANNGTITVTASNGFTSVYTYAIKLNSAATYTTQTSNQFTGLAAGTYNIKVIDSKGCESAVSNVTIINPAIVGVSAVVTTPFSCSTTNTKNAAVITVTGSGGSGTYTYSFDNGASYGPSNTLTVNDNGATQSFDIKVKDSNDCLSLAQHIDLAPLNPPTDLAFSNAAVTCTATTTTVTVTATNGVGTLQYETIAPSPIIRGKQTSNSFATLTPGTYTFKVTDANGCYYIESYEIKAVTPIAIAGNVDANIDCRGNSTGKATFTVSGNATVGAYTFTLTAGTLGTGTLTKSGNTLSLTNVVAGSYTVQVTDSATGCVKDATVTITQPAAALNISSANATHVNCNNDNSQITITATGGTLNYSYAYAKSPSTSPTSAYDSGSNIVTVDTNSSANLVWDVYVKDANGCTTKTTVTVISDPVPSVTAVVSNQCAGTGSNFTITATGTGGTGTLTYGINGKTGAFQSGNTFNVAPGTYTVWVKDANQCTASAAAPITVFSQLTASAVVTKTLDCSGTPDAVITTTIEGGKAPYTYTVKKGSGAPSSASAPSASLTITTSVSNANADTYAFEITDANGCKVTATTKVDPITNPTVVATPTQVSCNGGTNGAVTLAGSGGSGTLTYSFNNSGFTATTSYTGLKAGIAYPYQVKDSKGCVSTPATITLTQPTVLAVSASATSFSCNTSNVYQSATVTIDVPTTGTAPYTYSFNGGGYSSTRTLPVNDNGTNQTINYSVKDANGCIQGGTVTINKLNPPTIASITGTPIYCAPVAKTTSTVTVTRTAGTGVGTLTYEITAPLASATSNATGVFAGLAGGTTYTFKVTDANGCFAIDTYNVPAVTTIAVIATKLTDVDCFGNNTGSIRYNVSGFNSTYSYKVNGGTAVTGQTAATFTLPSLVANTYSVVFTDETTLCTAPTSIIINQPTAALSATYVKVNANCGVTTSKVTVTATGGTSPYSYAYKLNGVAPVAADYVVNSNVGNLNPTTSTDWDVWVKDSQGCTFKLDVTVAKDAVPTVTASVLNQCSASGSTFQIKAVGASGVAPYTYTINTGVAPSPADTFTVAAGTYTITVKDANGCTNTTSVTVNDALMANAILKKDLTCSAPANAQIDVTISGGKANFSYKVKFNGGAYGGSTSVAGNTFTTNPSAAGTYQFEITDANGCKKETNVITVNPTVNPVITSVTPTQSIKCNGDSTGIITVSIDATKGLGPFTYSIDGSTFQSSNVFTGLTAGSYNVTVKDSKGCINTVPAGITIAQPNAITFDLTKVDITCNAATGSSLGSITISNVLGGTASPATPFKYFITNNFGDVILGNPYSATVTGRENHTFTIINYGIYTINVIDANGCSLTKQITIASPPSDLTIDVTTLSSDCATGGKAVVKVISAVGSGNYEFGILEFNTAPYTTTWVAPDVVGGSTATFSNLIPGVTYTFVVHDKTTQCYYVKAANQPIAPASPLKSNVIAQNVTCKGANNGSVTFTLTGFDATTTSVDYQIFNAFTNVAVGAVGNKVVTGMPPFTVTVPSPGNLSPGQYYIKFIENGTGAFNGCKSASAIFEIKESSIALSVSASVVKNENCDNLGIITALAKDGTAPYSYMITTSAVAPSPTDPAWNTTSTFNKAAGIYYVHAKDAYNCIQPSAVVNLIKDPSPVIAPSVVNKCVAEGAFSISVARTTAGIGAHSISVDNSTFTSVAVWPHTVTGLNSGAHTIVVKDANGCIDTELITIAKPLVATPAITALPTCANNDGVITMSGTGGTGTYTYTIVPMPVGVTIVANVISKLPAGTYTVTMTDTATPTACSTTASVKLIAPTPVTFTTTTTKVLCSGDSNGSITVNLGAGNDNPSYTYQIMAGPVTRPVQPSNVFTGLPAGNYTVRVNSGRGCSTSTPNVIVGSPTPLDATSAITTPLSCGASNAAQPATVTVTGTVGTGTAPYKYSFDGGANYSSTNTYQSYVGIKFDVYVKDANGCVFILTDGVNIPALAPPTGLTFSTTVAVTCGGNATVEITSHTGGVGTLQYEILSPITKPKQISTTFTGLAAGTYLFQVTDANNCTYQDSYPVAPVTPIAIVGTIGNDISCNAANGINNSGSAKFTVTGFSASGNYDISTSPVVPAAQISNVGDVITLTGLSAGTYTVTVRDRTTGCTKSDSVTFTEPAAIAFTATASKVFCSKDISQITVSGVTGGTGVYSYAVVSGGALAPAAGAYTNVSTLSVDTNLNPANLSWDVYVKDANGCISKKNVVVVNNVPPTITPPAPQCYVGSPLTVNLSTLTTTYNGTKLYTVNGSSIATSTATFNAPGSYVLGIKDDNGCEAFVTYKIEKQLLATATLTKDLYCTGTVNATINVAITNGVAPYTYQMYLGGVATGVSTPVTGSAFTASVATAGTYTFVIKDSNAASCTVTTNAVTVTAPVNPTAGVAQINVSCIGGNNGAITITPANGKVPYTYKLTGPVVNTTGDATGIYTGLIAGTYTFVVTDAKNCTFTDTVTIIEPTAIAGIISVTTGLSCGSGNATQPATVTVTASGGTTPYQYSFNGGVNYSSTNTFNTNLAGPVTAWIKDGNGCIITTPISTAVVPLDAPTDLDFTATPVYCNPVARQTSTVTLTATNGVGPLSYVILSPAPATGNVTGASSGVFSGLAPDTYTFQVKDANGCTYQESFTVDPVNNITVAGQIISDVTCFGAGNGTAQFNVTNFAGNYNYVFDSAPVVLGVNTAQLTFTNLTPGTHTLVVTDAVTGCTNSASVNINQPSAALDFIASATNINCNNDNAVITVTATGGTLPYKYAAVIAGGAAPAPTAFSTSNQVTVDTNTGVNMGWDVYIIDANGCPLSKPQTIVSDANPTIATAIATQCPSPTGTYTITVSAYGFSSALEYSIDGVSFQTSNIITVNAPGNYNVTVKDANGCPSATTAVNIVQPLTLEPTVTTMPSCANNDGVITVTASGGSGNYQYKIDSGSYGSSTSFNGVASGSHTLYVKDTTTLCEVSVSVNLTPATPITGFGLSKTDVTCNGGNDGTITATLATPAPGVNDNPVYMYSLNGGTPQVSNVFTGLTAGNYNVVVTSGRGCSAPASIPVIEPGIITVPSPTLVPFGCASGNAMNFATITVNSVTGGSGTYPIYEFFKNGTSVQRGASNVYTESDLTGGSYTVTVYDDKGCQGSTSTPITIAPFTPMDNINVVVNKAIDCNNPENITVTAVDASGVAIAGVQYTLADKNATTGVIGGVYPAQTNTTGVFTGLPVANYIITATNPTTGCSIQGVHYVNEPNTFDLTIDNIVDVTCFGGANGSANVTIVDKTMPDQAGPFSYTLVAPNGTSTTGNSSTAGPLVLNSLVAGNYTIIATLTNNPFCSVSKVFAINQPTAALKISETDTPITCAGNDGTISATAIGGWPGGYEFELTGPVNVAYSTQSNFNNLSAGLYTVSVRDSKGCVDQVQVTLVNPTPIVASIVVDKPMLACFGDTDATITVQQPVTGGSGVYKYTLEATYPNGTVSLNGPQTSNVFTNLGVGSYRVTVSDTWNCSVWTTPVDVKEPTVVTASLVKTTSQTCLSPATLTLSAAGGTGLYSYSADPNFATVLGSFTSSVTFSIPFTTVPAKYVYYVKDANGCSNAVSNDIDVTPLEPLDFSFENINPYINCLGDNDGEITAIAQGGLGNYVYTLLDGSGNALQTTPTQLTPGHFSQLIAGNYIVRVTSGDCQISKPITITQPNSALTYTAAVTNVTCNGNGDGKVVLTGSGGTGVIKYAISPDLDKFLDSGTFLNLVVGHYQAVIQDVNGCNNIYDFDITEPAPITVIVDPLSIKQELCSGEKTGEFTIGITGGTAPYSTSIDGDAFVLDRVSFTGLSGGKHTVIVKDANLCEFTLDELLNPAVTLDPQELVSNDCVNDAPANKVTVTVDPSNIPADVTYSLDSSGVWQSSNVFTNLTPGSHFVMVQHKNGCIDATEPFTIEQIDPLAMSIDLGGLNEIVATVTGGSGVYRFSVNGVDIGSNNKYIYFHSGDYTVTVTDSNGCSFSRTKYFEFIDIVIPPIFTPTGDGTNDTWKPTNTENYPDIKFVVYDRYGREVGIFGAGQSWDGKYNGTELPMGDYWYVLKLRHTQDDREFIGHFTLYR